MIVSIHCLLWFKCNWQDETCTWSNGEKGQQIPILLVVVNTCTSVNTPKHTELPVTTLWHTDVIISISLISLHIKAMWPDDQTDFYSKGKQEKNWSSLEFSVNYASYLPVWTSTLSVVSAQSIEGVLDPSLENLQLMSQPTVMLLKPWKYQIQSEVDELKTNSKQQ